MKNCNNLFANFILPFFLYNSQKNIKTLSNTHCHLLAACLHLTIEKGKKKCCIGKNENWVVWERTNIYDIQEEIYLKLYESECKMNFSSCLGWYEHILLCALPLHRFAM